jgi:cyclophilin family peptidyl-prolyl cis-trans isomerase
MAQRALCLAVLLTLVSVLSSCIRFPPEELSLQLTASETTTVAEGDTATLTARASGGVSPYSYRWQLEDGPGTVQFDSATVREPVVGPFSEQGDYTFRVTAQDRRGLEGEAYVMVLVGPADIEPGEFNVFIEREDDSEDPEDTEINVGTTLSLNSFVDRENVSYQWEVIRGDATLDSPQEASTAVVPNALGQLTVQLTVTDLDTNEEVTTEASYPVVPVLEVDELYLAIAGQEIELQVVPDPSPDDLLYNWSVVEGEGFVETEDAPVTNMLTVSSETVLVRVTVTVPAAADEEPVMTSREVRVVSVLDDRPQVRFETRLGSFTFELFADDAPLTVANFLAYVDDEHFDNQLIHRVAYTQDEDGNDIPFVIQGGGVIRDDEGELEYVEPPRDPVTSEAENGRTNGELYTVAMALSAGNADSGTTQWFVNMTDNSFLDDQSFTVFATVIEGRDVLDAITQVERETSPLLGGEESLPVEDIVMTNVYRVDVGPGDDDDANDGDEGGDGGDSQGEDGDEGGDEVGEPVEEDGQTSIEGEGGDDQSSPDGDRDGEDSGGDIQGEEEPQAKAVAPGAPSRIGGGAGPRPAAK